VATAASLVRRAAADVLVLPELFLTGYELDPSHAVSSTDPRLDPLAAACAETRTAVMVSAPTRDADGAYISALVFGRDGQLAAQYNKQHLDAAERAAGFCLGASGCTITIDGWRLGLGICWDSSFPEHSRAAALDGCHAYLVSGLFAQGRGERKRATLGPARAIDNACYVAISNHNGQSGPYTGSAHSAIWDPNGVLLADAGEADPGLAVAQLDPDALTAARAQDLTFTDPSFTPTPTPRTASPVA
jgi:predicted amidohydrolase